jgi:hypothetical protein
MDSLTKSADFLVHINIVELVLAVISLLMVNLYAPRLGVQNRARNHISCVSVALPIPRALCPDHFSSSNSLQICCNTTSAPSQHVDEECCASEKGRICRVDPPDHYWRQGCNGLHTMVLHYCSSTSMELMFHVKLLMAKMWAKLSRSH